MTSVLIALQAIEMIAKTKKNSFMEGEEMKRKLSILFMWYFGSRHAYCVWGKKEMTGSETNAKKHWRRRNSHYLARW